MKFVSRPVTISAVHYAGGWDDVRAFVEGDGKMVKVDNPAYETDGDAPEFIHVLEIETLEGTMRADAGDWLIRGTMGELYPCKPDVFEKKYRPIEGAAGV